jgi:hypothetical protein
MTTLPGSPHGALERLMGVGAGKRASATPAPCQPHTSFLYAGPYDPTLAVPTDLVRLYGYSDTWIAKGYAVQLMMHSRFGERERPEPSEFQTDRDGNPWGTAHVYRDEKLVDLVVGALPPSLEPDMRRRHGRDVAVRMDDHYKVPTEPRTRQFIEHFASLLAATEATGIGFDEPEFWASTGYSEAFRQEWRRHYGVPWLPPHRSIEARYRADQLKALLFCRHVEAILRAAQERKPAAVRLLSAHSPVGYYGMGIVAAHHQLVSIPAVQEVIAEVWNLPFADGYVEYSSMGELIRGTGKRLWLFMDPMGDHPGLPLAFYRKSFSQNLVSALMFPRTDCYEVLAWPQRIFGHVPKEYETIVNSVVGALSEMWRYPDGKVRAGVEGVGTFFSDSMAWQRGDPSPSDFDGFRGLSLTLVKRGVPVRVLSLDRVAEPGYLDGLRVLLLSYDFLKPANPAVNQALADWCGGGGTLLFAGGTDAYNALADSWWRRAGYASPGEDLFARMGLPLGPGRTRTATADPLVLASAGGRRLPDQKIPARYPVTVYPAPEGARPLYTVGQTGEAAVWEAAAGKGRAVFCGVAPGYMQTATEGGEWIRALVRLAVRRAGGRYREAKSFSARRGPYTAVAAVNGAVGRRGRFVDLLDPGLAVRDNPAIPAGECAFLADAGPAKGRPRLMAASGRVLTRYEVAGRSSFLVRAPDGTQGVARLWSGGRAVRSLAVFAADGQGLQGRSAEEGDTVVVRYPNRAEGVVVRVDWTAGPGQ